MDENACPWCGRNIPASAINVAEGVGLCAECGRLSRLSQIVQTDRPLEEVIDHPPGGCSMVNRGDEVAIRASLRSCGGAIVVLFFAVFWNGIVSVFVLVALAGLYTHFIGPLPDWFPAPQVR